MHTHVDVYYVSQPYVSATSLLCTHTHTPATPYVRTHNPQTWRIRNHYWLAYCRACIYCGRRLC